MSNRRLFLQLTHPDVLLEQVQVASFALQHLVHGAAAEPHAACSNPAASQQQQHCQLVGAAASAHASAMHAAPRLNFWQLWPSQQQSLLRQQHGQLSCWRDCWQQQWPRVQQVQLRHYHRATHAARALTTRLLQQRTWQELRLLFDASGGGGRLNTIQLCALLQHMARLAPAPELLNATERAELGAFADELTAACMQRVQRFDAVGLANVISSALKLGCTLPLQPPPQQLDQTAAGGAAAHIRQSGAGDSTALGSPPTSGSSEESQQQQPLYVQLLQAATKQVAFADGHAAGLLLAALANLQQQLAQQSPQAHQQLQQPLGPLGLQLQLWCGFTAALAKRLQECAAVGQLSSQDASKLCSSISRLAGTLARQRTAAAAALSGQLQSQQHQQQEQPGCSSRADNDKGSSGGMLQEEQASQEFAEQQSSTAAAVGAMQQLPEGPAPAAQGDRLQRLQLGYGQLQQQLRALLSLAAQQVQPVGAPKHPTNQTAPGPSLSDTSRVLSALAKTWAWPGWPAVLGLVSQYSAEVQESAAALSQQQQQAGRKGKKGRQQQQQLGLVSGLPAGLLAAGLGAGAAAAEGTGGAAEAWTAVQESLTPAVWAIGRLAEQQLQHLQRRSQRQQQQQQETQSVQAEVQQHVQLWQAVLPVLAVCQQQLNWMGPLQLVQLATGLGKLFHSSRALLQGASAAGVSTEAGQQAGTAGARLAAGTSATVPGQQAQSAAAGSTPGGAAGGPEHELSAVLEGPALHRLLQQHVRRVEAVLPLLVLQHRVQIAAAYSQLGVQPPRSMAAVFERDAAQQQ